MWQLPWTARRQLLERMPFECPHLVVVFAGGIAEFGSAARQGCPSFMARPGNPLLTRPRFLFGSDQEGGAEKVDKEREQGEKDRLAFPFTTSCS